MDDDQVEFLTGNDENNILVGANGRDFARGNDGDDTLVGDLNRDTLIGGEGDDLIVGGGVVSEPLELALALSEEVTSGVESPQLQPPATFAELLVGGAGNDVIVGGSWTDEDGDRFVDASIAGGEVFLSTTDLTTSPGYNNIIWGGVGDDMCSFSLNFRHFYIKDWTQIILAVFARLRRL